MAGLLDGKCGLIAGLSERHGVAWGVTQACVREGARLAFTYQERFKRQAEELTNDIAGSLRIQVDNAADDALVGPAMAQVDRKFGGLDFLIHSIAFAPTPAMTGRVKDTTREDFHTTMDASVYTLLALTRAAEPLFAKRGGGSVVAMTYFGGEKVVLGYKIMGVAKATLDSMARYLAADLGPENIRVNLLSLGPLRTAAARGIPGFLDMMRAHAERAALRRNVDTDDAGNATVFLCSDMGRNITGEILHVDGGYTFLGA